MFPNLKFHVLKNQIDILKSLIDPQFFCHDNSTLHLGHNWWEVWEGGGYDSRSLWMVEDKVIITLILKGYL